RLATLDGSVQKSTFTREQATELGAAVDTFIRRPGYQGIVTDYRVTSASAARSPALADRLHGLFPQANSHDFSPYPPEVRREILLLLRFLPNGAQHYILSLAKLYDGQDHFYRAALNIACGTDPKRRDAILADFDKQFPEWNDNVADLVWELRPKSMLPRLEKLLVDDKLTATQKGRIVDILAVYDEPATGKVLLALLTADAPADVKARALENLQRYLPTKWNALTKSEEFKTAINQFLGKFESTRAGLQLVAATKYAPALPLVVRLASLHDKEAIRTLGKLPEPRAVAELEKTLGALRARSRAPMSPPLPLDVAEALIAALGEQAGGRNTETAALATRTLQVSVTSADEPIELKRAAVNALAGSRAGTEWLLDVQ